MHAALHNPEQTAWRLTLVGTVIVRVAARRPAHGALHGQPRRLFGRRMLGAVIERHGNVRAQRQLHVHRVLRRQAHLAAIDRGAKAHALLADAAQAPETENLEAA